MPCRLTGLPTLVKKRLKSINETKSIMKYSTMQIIYLIHVKTCTIKKKYLNTLRYNIYFISCGTEIIARYTILKKHEVNIKSFLLLLIFIYILVYVDVTTFVMTLNLKFKYCRITKNFSNETYISLLSWENMFLRKFF